MKALGVVAMLVACSLCPAASLKYWVDECARGSAGCHPGDPELAEWAMQAWQSASGSKLKLQRTNDREHAQIRIVWANGQDGLYGETRQILVDGVRGAEVYIVAPTANASGEDPLLRETVLYLTCLHEAGHALGLEHTNNFADIMYNFQFGGDIAEYFARYRRQLGTRDDIRHHSGMSDNDRRRLLEIFH